MMNARRVFCWILVVLTWAGSLYGQNPRQQEKRYLPYATRIAQAESRLPSVAGAQRASLLDSLCRLYWLQAELYGEMWRASTIVLRTYLEFSDSINTLDPVYTMHLGMIYVEGGDGQKAVKALQKAIQMRGVSPANAAVAKAWLGAAHVLEGSKEKGRAAWDECGKASPDVRFEARFLAARFDPEWYKRAGRAVASGNQSRRVQRSLAYIACVAGDLTTARKLSSTLDPALPLYVEKKGTLEERSLYDPAMLAVMHRVAIELCGSYAEELNTLPGASSEQKAASLLYMGMVSYERGDWQRSIFQLRASSDANARAYLAAALVHAGNRAEAEREIQLCLGSSGPEAWSTLSALLVRADVQEYHRHALAAAQNAVDAVLEAKKKDHRVPQQFFSNLGLACETVGLMEDALVAYHRGWNAAKASDLVANDPVFLVRHATCYVTALHLRQLSTAIGLMSHMRDVYPESKAIAEPMNSLNTLTNATIDNEVKLKVH
ncbi:MAG: hypothetical protein IPI01_16670 [Ignavibacteriae bacterium]|nr:hypothetical protein [Ignavibacteriota bacterium]